MKSYKDQEIEVVGVSGDAVKTQDAFKKAQKLEFTLLADEQGQVAKAFGVPTGKGGVAKAKVDGQEEQFTRALTIQRWTFIIDKSGKIAYKNPKVVAAEDSKAVMEAIQKLK